MRGTLMRGASGGAAAAAETEVAAFRLLISLQTQTNNGIYKKIQQPNFNPILPYKSEDRI